MEARRRQRRRGGYRHRRCRISTSLPVREQARLSGRSLEVSASCTRHPMCPSSAQNSVVCYGVLNSQEKRLILARIPFPADGEHPWKLTDGEFVTKNLKDGTLAKRPVGTHWVPNVMDTKQNLKYLPATTPHRIAPALGIRWQNVSLADERYLPDSADAFRRMGGLVRRRGGEGGAASANKGTYWVFYETSVQVQTFMWAVPVECKMQGLELQLEKLTDDPEGAIRREIEGEVFMAVGVVLEEEKRANREKNRARMATQRAPLSLHSLSSPALRRTRQRMTSVASAMSRGRISRGRS
jgi:hypothetical protein